MDDFSEKINALLSDEESMRQIRELRELLAGGDNAEAEGNVSDGIESFDETPTAEADGKHEENLPMPDISGLLGMLSGAGGARQESSGDGLGGLDMGTLMKLMSVIQSAENKNDSNRNVLLALRPMLGADKQAKIDKAVKMLHVYALYNAIKDSGISLF